MYNDSFDTHKPGSPLLNTGKLVKSLYKLFLKVNVGPEQAYMTEKF